MKAEIYTDVADDKLAAFAKTQLKALNVDAEVKTGSLHAGTACCNQAPIGHFESADFPYHQAEPTFSEDIVIPWEGKRLVDLVRKAALPTITSGGRETGRTRERRPRERRKLTAATADILDEGRRECRAFERGSALRVQAGL